MEKEKQLEQIRLAMATGKVTKNEVLAIIERNDKGIIRRPGTDKKKKFNLADVLYYIGAGIVAIGIAVLIGQHWHSLNSFTRVAATLGVTLAAYYAAVRLHSRGLARQIANAGYFITGAIMPIGIGVILYQTGYDLGNLGVENLLLGLAFAFFVISWALLRQTVLLVFSILYGSAFFLSLTGYLIRLAPTMNTNTFNDYRFAVLGLSLTLLGYALAKTAHKTLTGALYGFGLIILLLATLLLGGFRPAVNIGWEIVYPGIVFAVILLSIWLRSKSFLTWGVLFLMLYILKITAEYFTNSLGWPLALVLAGLLLIGIGALSVGLNKRYLARPAV